MNAPRCNDPMIAGVDPMPADVASPLHPTPLPLAPVGAKAVDVDFDGGRLSSDAGVVLLTDLDDHLGLTRALAAVLSARRETRRLHFPPEDFLKHRVVQIAAGYEAANDANTLRDDPLCTLLRDRRPETGAPLASQPTISRCENRVSRPALSRMAVVLLEQCLASSASPPKVVVREGDDTEDPVQGAQEQARYAG